MKAINIYAFADEASASIDMQIAAMKRNGLQGLEIRNVDGVNVSDITLEKAQEVHQKLKAAGLKVWSIGSPLGKVKITAKSGDTVLATAVKPRVAPGEMEKITLKEELFPLQGEEITVSLEEVK